MSDEVTGEELKRFAEIGGWTCIAESGFDLHLCFDVLERFCSGKYYYRIGNHQVGFTCSLFDKFMNENFCQSACTKNAAIIKAVLKAAEVKR